MGNPVDSGHVEGKDGRIRSLMDVSTKLRRIAKLAEDRPETTFTTLAHQRIGTFVPATLTMNVRAGCITAEDRLRQAQR